jgi:hypothetical protein
VQISRSASQAVAETVLPIRIGTGGPVPYRIVGRVPLSVQAGDLVDVRASYQVSSEHSYNIMVSRTVTLADTAVAVPGAFGTFMTQLCRPMAQNFNGKAEHHFMDSLSGTWIAPATFAACTLYASVTVYVAASTLYAKPGDICAADFVDVQALVTRGYL